jgi:hypothetical protein
MYSCGDWHIWISGGVNNEGMDCGVFTFSALLALMHVRPGFTETTFYYQEMRIENVDLVD